VLSSSVAVLVDPEPESLAKGILSVLENPTLGEEIGSQARRFFEEKCNFQTYLKKTGHALNLALG
jgi:glycosyltransferase involved in cell wall biosynthesis